MIRAQIGAGARRNERAAADQSVEAPAPAPLRDSSPISHASNDAEIQRQVALRVRGLSPDDPQRQRKAYRLFLESVLVQAFGRERLSDRGLDQMVDVVLQRMESDAQLLAALRQAGDQLLADATARPDDSG